VRTDNEKALKGAPHALFGIAEAAFLGDGLDRYDGLFELAAGRIGPRPFGKLRWRHSGFAAKEPGEIARAHGHAIRQGGYAEILPRVPQDPGLKFLYLWPAPHFQVFHIIGAELGLPPGAAGENHHHPGGGKRNFPAEIFFNQGQGQINPRDDPARRVNIPVASEEEAGIDLNRRVFSRKDI
jgi:hypothetical protein